MANSTIGLTSSLVMIALFSIAIIGFGITFANDNDASINIADDNINTFYSQSKDNLSTFKSESEETYTSIVSSKSEPGSDSIKSPGAFTITWSNVFGVITNIVTIGYEKIFGKGGDFQVFLYTFLALISFIAGLLIIKTWRGNP